MVSFSKAKDPAKGYFNLSLQNFPHDLRKMASHICQPSRGTSCSRSLWLAYLLLMLASSDALSLTSGQRIASRLKERKNIIRNNISDREYDSSHKPLSLFDLPAIENWGMQQGLKEHHLKTLYRVVMNSTLPMALSESGISLEDQLMKAGFPKRHTTNLLSHFAYTCSIVRVEPSNGGYKFVIQLGSGKLVETVLIRHERNNGHVRYTVCVSSQVGCAKKCSFCATGTMGLQGQLNSGEILEQVFLARDYLISHQGRESVNQMRCVFMGMGEPLDCYDEVHEALRGLTHQCLFGLKAKHVTVSTVGASASKIRLLADEAPQVSLALSLHSAIQQSREKLIPSANANPIDSLGESLDYHSSKSGRGAMLEYLLIEGVNDSDAEVSALAKFCEDRNKKGQVFVNLIPYNPTLAGDDFGYQTPSDERIYKFHDSLKALGVKSLVRWSSASGRDANGACGQLVLNSS